MGRQKDYEMDGIKHGDKLNALYNIYRVSQEQCARLREGVPYVKIYRYNPKHLYPKSTTTHS
jgi:hypothetical protein